MTQHRHPGADAGLPVGTIITYGGAAPFPAPWLECNGEQLDSEDYPALYATIGTAFGGEAPNFYLPDLRGMFLRGVSGDSKRDPDASLRTALQQGGNTGNAIGSVQAADVVNHQHNWSQNFELITHGGENIGVQLDNNSPQKGNAGTQPTTNVDGGNPGNETRPVNTYVYFLIKSA